MNLSQIEEEIRDCIHEEDEGIELEDSLTLLVNEALEEISESMDVVTLRKMNVVQTDTTAPYLVMPSDFSGRLVYVGDSNGKLTVLKGGLTELLYNYPGLDETGDIALLAVENKLLYYQPTPSEVKNLTVLYYASPKKLASINDVPDWLPEYLHRGLVVNKAVEMRFRRIEEGIEGEMVNTVKYRGYYEDAKTMLQVWLSRRRSSVGTSVWSD
jgi:hypothetical protein